MLTPIFDNNKKLKKVVVIQTDITYRKSMEEQIRASLEEKGLLLREIHHRVKNNLQIIISLFNLQSHYVNDEGAFAALKEGQDRIKSMALIHERFYQNDGLSRIDFDEYIKRLVENLLLSFNVPSGKITYTIEAEKISLDIDTAVPCGLIINELVSNTIKHAFAENEQGELQIVFRKLEGDELELIIHDNGRGLPEDFSIDDSDSLGMQLINALANQLDAKLMVESGKGATFRLKFSPVHKATENV
jgi:two-component sensor histidine kinase